MFEYLTPLDFRWISEDEVVLLQPFVLAQNFIKLDLPPYVDPSLIIVPPGTHIDGGSVPRVAWSIVGHPFDSFLYEATIHDWLYATHFCSRSDADDLFLECMAYFKVVNKITRHTMYQAVRRGGGRVWNNKTVEIINYYRNLLDKYVLDGNSPDSWECPLGPSWSIA